jgi:hypothetical protein
MAVSARRQQELLTVSDRGELVRVEKNLNSFGFFTPSHKRVESLAEKTVTVLVRNRGGQRAEARATILPNARYGLPTTADQDKYYAFQKIVQDMRWREGRIANPVGFTSAQMLRLLGRKKSGQGYREIGEWLERMTLTGIRSEGVVYFAGARKYMRDTFTVFSRVVTVGRQMPDGSKADRNWVWLSEWQLENLNASYVLPIDYDAYRSLRLNISKALLPLMQIWFYAARRASMPQIEKRYSTLCELLSIRRYQHLSKIKEILGPSLEELVRLQIVEEWEVRRTADGDDYKLVLRPGERFLTDRRARLLERPTADAEFEGALQALITRGVQTARARRILLEAEEDQAVLDQIEYGDAEIARRNQGRDPIANPSGFFVYLVQNNVPVPAEFQTTRRTKLARLVSQGDETGVARQAEQELQRDRLRFEYEEYLERESMRWLQQHYREEDLQRLLVESRMLIRKEFRELCLPEQVLEELAWKRLRQEHLEQAGILSWDEYCRQEQMSLAFDPTT